MNRLYLIIFICLSGSSRANDLGLKASDVEDLISAKEWQEMFAIAGSIAASCTDKIWTNQADLATGVKEIVLGVAQGVVKVGGEFATGLYFKKDFPNACHILTQDHLKGVTTSEYETRPCIWRDTLTGWCGQWETRQHKEYRYHWPKYFIEVSEKGNDPHPAFAAGNKLYAANRKIASMFDNLVDIKGPFSITAKVLGASALVERGTATFLPQNKGVKFDATPGAMGQMAQTAVLTPLEKLRIRANKEQNQPSYEVNIWPVALSKSMAEHLTICGDGKDNTDEGGFGWPIPGVGMTCPIAMAKDAWPYWDSGMLDYLNPNAVRGIVTASDPLTCAADNLSALAFDEYGAKGFSGAAGDSSAQNSLEGQIARLAPSLQGLRYCSFPIMGDTEAIYNQTIGLLSSFKGPWCTLWGPMVPRNSTTSFQNDYSFVNSALKFKTLAHDLFGIPRGNKERWSLAYPWEEDGGGVIGDLAFGDWAEGLKEHLREKLPKKFDETLFGAAVGRSRLLAAPGDPRMVDFSFRPGTDLKNLSRELVYLASLKTSADVVEKEAIKTLERKVSGPKTSSEILRRQERDLAEAEDVTAREDEEEIWEYKSYCHVAAARRGTLVGSAENSFAVGYRGYVTSSSTFDFTAEASKRRCHGHDIGGCVKRDWKGKCVNKRKGQLIFYRRLEKVGTKKVKHPKVWRIERGQCHKSYQNTATVRRDFVTCDDKKVLLEQKDTRDYARRPDPSRPESIVQENDDTAKAVGLAAKTAVFVGAELARAKYEEFAGRSFLPGKKRIYTIHEEVSCRPPGYTAEIGPVTKYFQCKDAARIEIKKFIQQRLIRRMCDVLLRSPLGAPFKRGE